MGLEKIFFKNPQVPPRPSVKEVESAKKVFKKYFAKTLKFSKSLT
jgi:hypothetical protein